MQGGIISEYVCIELKSTLCDDRRCDQLVVNTKHSSELVERWEGWSKIKHFYCDTDTPVDVEKYSRMRLEYYDHARILYEPSRRIPIDTKSPGNFSDIKQVDDALAIKIFESWNIIPGPRPR